MSVKIISIPAREDQFAIETGNFPQNFVEREFETLSEALAYKAGFEALTELTQYYLGRTFKKSQEVVIDGVRAKFPINSEDERVALLAGLEDADGWVAPIAFFSNENADRYDEICKLIAEKAEIELLAAAETSEPMRKEALQRYASDERNMLLAVVMAAATGQNLKTKLVDGKHCDFRVTIYGSNDTWNPATGELQKWVREPYDPINRQTISPHQFLNEHSELYSNDDLKDALKDAIAIFGKPFSSQVCNIPKLPDADRIFAPSM